MIFVEILAAAVNLGMGTLTRLAAALVLKPMAVNMAGSVRRSGLLRIMLSESIDI